MHTKIIHMFTITTLLIGVLFTFSGGQNVLQAQITGKGSHLLQEEPPIEELILDAGVFHAAPTVFVSQEQTSSLAILVLGALLVFLGLTVHALIVLRKHPVHAHIRSHDRKDASKPSIYEYESWIRIFRNI
ncbi:hypothetical protein A2635_02235 [Candidatus Peribacteria bacterium RIFCSPHIGHO2_01_FULL_51_9]|nr:MAG: hypothetical protein A2635_02235 [Candidatus Peribacteria bacterium RIFCSPHIGHO2_01_FULL_51_9]